MRYGIIRKVFWWAGKIRKNNGLAWIALQELSQLETIKEDSFTKPQLIFKHSTTCGISAMVLNRFTSSYGLTEEEITLHFLDLHAFRPISNAVADEFGVIHQSPQLIIVKNGEVVFHTSHGAINEVSLAQFV